MIRLEKLQFLGPSLLLIIVGAAESAAWGLAHAPASAVLWFVNLEIFGSFQRSYTLLPFQFPYSPLLLIAVPLFIVASFGFFMRQRFLLALASSLSFIYAAFLLVTLISNEPHALTASVGGIAVPSEPNFYPAIILVAASLISFLISHFQYLRRFVG